MGWVSICGQNLQEYLAWDAPLLHTGRPFAQQVGEVPAEQSWAAQGQDVGCPLSVARWGDP